MRYAPQNFFHYYNRTFFDNARYILSIRIHTYMFVYYQILVMSNYVCSHDSISKSLDLVIPSDLKLFHYSNIILLLKTPLNILNIQLCRHCTRSDACSSDKFHFWQYPTRHSKNFSFQSRLICLSASVYSFVLNWFRNESFYSSTRNVKLLFQRQA